MKEFLFTGGINGMLTILVLGIAVIIVAIVEIVRRVSGHSFTETDRRLMLSIPSLGGIAVLFSMFFQVLGLYQAYQAIMMADDISPMIVMGGVFVSFYAPLFGLGVGLVSFVIWYMIRLVWGGGK